jgi:hypothetical protein
MRYVADPKSRFEATTLIEAMDARVISATLKKDVIAISCPCLGESSLNDCAAMPLPTKIPMGDDIFEEPVPTSAA